MSCTAANRWGLKSMKHSQRRCVTVGRDEAEPRKGVYTVEKTSKWGFPNVRVPFAGVPDRDPQGGSPFHGHPPSRGTGTPPYMRSCS